MSKEFLEIQAAIKCGFTLKRVRDKIKTNSQTGSCVSHLLSFTPVTGMPVEIASVSINLVFLISNGIFKMFLKTMKRNRA